MRDSDWILRNREKFSDEKTLERVLIAPAAQKDRSFQAIRRTWTTLSGDGPAVQVDAYDLRDAGLLHGDAVDDIGLRHRAFAVSDDDELC